MSLYLSGQLVEWFGNMEGSETLKPIMTHCVSLLASWILLFLVYALMPNTRVSVSAAAIGSAVSAVLWELAKYGFQIYLSEAVPYSLYGSLGLIPLFLFWIYLTWLVVLFGLILTYTLQVLGGHLPDEFETEDSATLNGDPDWMLPIMCEVVNAFDTGLALDHQSLANRIGLSTRTVNELVSHLTEANLLRQVNLTDSHIGLTLARPADKITLVEILDLAADICPPHKHPAWKTFSSLKEAERQAAQGKTLADADI
jgi:membrane protein